LDGNGPVLAALAEDPKGLACTSLGSALRSIAGGKPLKILAIDGVTPTTETVRDGTYTAQRPLLVITKGKPTAEIDLFFRYLASKAGQQIVEEMDCISLSRSE
jgi:phosphate transport system substrate-binding protein